jgi:4-amino-4-deoxy-L-arabinose transferase-like glycosyltransferase
VARPRLARGNPGWAHFYIIYEHWQRYTETGHARTGQFWIFVPIVLLGLFPWTGFLWCAFRTALAGGWARRKENAEAWFFATWALFIFLFFSKSQSKLIPYILPVFPPDRRPDRPLARGDGAAFPTPTTA